MINNIKKKLNIILVILMIFFIMPFNNVNAEEIEPTIVRVGWFQINGFQETDLSGEHYGYNYEYLRLIEDSSNIKFEYVDGEISDLFEQLKNGEIDMLGGINFTKERENQFLYSNLSYGYNSSLIVSRLDSNDAFNDFNSLNGEKVIVFDTEHHINGFNELVSDNNIECEVENSDNVEDMIRRLDNGEVDFIILDSLNQFADHKIVGEYNFGNFFFIFSKDNVELKDEISDKMGYIQVIDKNIQYDLREKYFYNHNIVAFSKEEYDFINQSKALVVGLEVNDNILSKYDEDTNTFSGVDYNVMEIISLYTNLKFEYKLIPNSMTKIEALESGFCDILPGVWVSDTSVSNSNIELSSIYFNDELTLIYNKGTNINSNLMINFPSIDEGVINYINEKFPEWIIVNKEKNDIDESLLDLLDKEVDGVLLSKYEGNYYSKNPKFENLTLYYLNDVINYKSIAVRKENIELKTIINKSLDYLDNNINSSIASALISNDYQPTWRDQIFENLVNIVLVVLGVFLLLILFLMFDNRRVRILEFRADEAKKKLLMLINQNQIFLLE